MQDVKEVCFSSRRLYLLLPGAQPNLTICHIPELPATRWRGTFYIPTRLRPSLHWPMVGGWTGRTTVISPARIVVAPGRILNSN